jgi:AcrR family transcriptional regulator
VAPTADPLPRPYHHGDLRRALLAEAIDQLAEVGPAALNLRDVARRVGVSHAAPRHHFGDKRGLLTAIAEEGFGKLADELSSAWHSTGSFLEVGVAYVRFATRNRVHFEVMYRPELYDPTDASLVNARDASAAVLYETVGSLSGARPDSELREAGVAAWSIAHGLATLWLGGNLPPGIADDPVELARSVLRHAF